MFSKAPHTHWWCYTNITTTTCQRRRQRVHPLAHSTIWPRRKFCSVLIHLSLDEWQEIELLLKMKWLLFNICTALFMCTVLSRENKWRQMPAPRSLLQPKEPYDFLLHCSMWWPHHWLSVGSFCSGNGKFLHPWKTRGCWWSNPIMASCSVHTVRFPFSRQPVNHPVWLARTWLW